MHRLWSPWCWSAHGQVAWLHMHQGHCTTNTAPAEVRLLPNVWWLGLLRSWLLLTAWCAPPPLALPPAALTCRLARPPPAAPPAC